MADMELRTNSLRLRFERGDPEPTDLDIFSFMREKMALKCDSLLSMYKEKNEMSVIIKFRKEEDAQRTLMRLPNVMEFRYNKYQSANVKLSMANAIIRYVRLFNLPPEVEDQEIQKVMEKYGKVTRMVREKYAEETGFPIWTSVRGVYMELKEDVEIPGTVMIRSLRARIFYDGLVNKCYQCGSVDHMKAECPQRKTVNDRLQAAGPSSYSEALSGGGRWMKKRETTHTAEGTSGTVTQTQKELPLQFTALPVATNNHAAPVVVEKEKKPEQPKSTNPFTLSQHQALESEQKSIEKNSDHTRATISDQPSAPTAIGGNEECHGATQSVTSTAASEQWKVKTKRGRKPAAKGKERNESESEHSTTESDYQIDIGKHGGEGKGVTTRSTAKSQKRSKVGENDDRDGSHLGENNCQREVMGTGEGK